MQSESGAESDGARRSALDFESLMDWLTEHEGAVVGVSMQGPLDRVRGNTGLHAQGVLRATHGKQVIDARPGRVLCYLVGDAASFQLLEGDFIEADRIDDPVDASVIVSAHFEDATLIVAAEASPS
jgi:hypothetical protein